MLLGVADIRLAGLSGIDREDSLDDDFLGVVVEDLALHRVVRDADFLFQ